MKSPVAFWAGVAIVGSTHTYMLVDLMPADLQKYHAILNLCAAGLIVYGSIE